MKALDLAMVEREIRQAGLSVSVREYLTELLVRDRGKRLELGRVHLAICQHIESSLNQGLTLHGYAIPTAVSLFGYEKRTVERIWKQYDEFSPETHRISHLKSAS